MKVASLNNPEKTSSVRQLLMVEDDRLILSTLSNGLRRAGYQVFTAESVEEAENWLSEQHALDLVILDVSMPHRSGLELSAQLNELYQIPFILLTAHSEQEVVEQAAKSGAMGYLVKPIDITQLIPAIETAISRSQEIKKIKETGRQLQIALDSDRSISIAVGIIMDQHQLNHEDAFELLRKTARSKQVKLSDFATSIISSREMLNLGNRA